MGVRNQQKFPLHVYMFVYMFTMQIIYKYMHVHKRVMAVGQVQKPNG